MRDFNIFKNFKREINLNTKLYNTNKKYEPSIEDSINDNESSEFEYDYDEDQEILSYDDYVYDDPNIETYSTPESEIDTHNTEIEFLKEYCLSKFVKNRGVCNIKDEEIEEKLLNLKGDNKDVCIVLAFIYGHNIPDAMVLNAYNKLKTKYNLFKVVCKYDFYYKFENIIRDDWDLDIEDCYGITEIVDNKVTDNSSFILFDHDFCHIMFCAALNANHYFSDTSELFNTKLGRSTLEMSPKLKSMLEIFI